MTYSFDPSLPDGLNFNPTTRRLSGEPKAAASEAKYTYKATDSNGATASLDMKVTIFDLSVMVKGPSDTARVKDLNRVRWGIPWRKEAFITDSIARADNWEVKIVIPSTTGIRMGDVCDSSAKVVSTDWIPLDIQEFDLVRCGQGSDNAFNIDIKIKKQSETGDGSSFSIRNVTVDRAEHYADNNVTYYIRGTTLTNKQGKIEVSIRGVSTGTLEGLFDSLGQGTPDPAPNAILLDPLTYSAPTLPWNNVGSGATISRTNTRDGADVIIQGFWDTQVGKGTGHHCGESVACIQEGNTYPHLASGRVMYIEDPPHWGGDDDARIWTNDFREWHRDTNKYAYLPKTLMHEFGHALGLGHSPRGDVMSGGVQECGTPPQSVSAFCGLSTNDKNALKEIYRGHTAH